MTAKTYDPQNPPPESDKYGGKWLVVYEDGRSRVVDCKKDLNIMVYKFSREHGKAMLWNRIKK
jgi:hypothetical protein